MKLSPLFTDNAVFAENKPIRVFGTGCGDITVSLDGDCVKAVCGGGKWIAELPAKKAGGPYELTVCGDTEKTVVKNVYTGRVYLLAGQSNAEFQLCQSNTDPALYEGLELIYSAGASDALGSANHQLAFRYAKEHISGSDASR